jgi:hypothetical protein
MGLAASLSAPAGAAFHLFRINEIYSSADGTVQFIELKESTGSNFESFWQGQTLTSMQGATTRTFTSVAYDPLPTDGITSINRNGVQALSSPTNFAGQTGSLIAPIPPSVVAANSIPVVGTVGLTLLALLVTLGAWHARPGVVKKR